MPCFHPIQAFQPKSGGPVVFIERAGSRPISIPCGQCIGCRLERSRQWAMRSVHEASLHSDNCFITLTYSPEKLPLDGSLIKSDFQDFMKRLRKKFVPRNPYNKKKQEKKWLEFHEKHWIRYYMCGEYGDRNNRPHYHAILFGHNFDDWVYLFDSPSGEPIYTSPTLEKVWKNGFVTVGTVTFESAGYVARYCMKKINGLKRDEINPDTGLKPYERYHEFTGEITPVLEEYADMSRRPGIGNSWISKFTLDTYPKDFTTIRGVRMKPPKYYDRYLESIDPDMYDDIKAGRMLSASLSDEGTVSRLRQKETVKKAQFNQLIRSL